MGRDGVREEKIWELEISYDKGERRWKLELVDFAMLFKKLDLCEESLDLLRSKNSVKFVSHIIQKKKGDVIGCLLPYPPLH